MRRIKFLNWVTLIVVLSLSAVVEADQGREIRPDSWKEDATINDVFALNEKMAWAVGDQGVILRTINGGQDWIASTKVGLDLDQNRSLEQKLGKMRSISQTRELYPLTCSFKSVFFLNERRGWVSGTYYKPYLNTSRSVLLTTADGGKSWRQIKGHFLPAFNRIHFQDLLGGWAIGNTGNLYNSGVFATSSGGQNWSVQEVKPSRNWIDGELIPDGFVVIDDEGLIGRIVGRRYEPAVILGKRPGKLSAVRMVDAKIGWAVGNSGTVLQTVDGGMTWQKPKSLTQDSSLQSFDFATLSIASDKVWIAGNPGTTVLSLNAKTGDNLEFHLTGHTSPLRRIVFLNRKKGWAVGAGATILSTKDGGKHWRSQHNTVEHSAILAVSADSQDLPMALFAYYSNEQNYISSLALIGSRSKLTQELAQSAVNRLGCATVIPIPGDDLRSELPQQSPERILAELVRTIRTLQPNVLVCNQTNGRNDDQLHALCRTAIELAGQNDAFVDQLDELALPPWKVDRFLVRQPRKADINFHGKRYLPRTGQLTEDQIAISRCLVGLSAQMTEAESYSVETFTGSVSARYDDIFFGLKPLGRTIAVRTAETRLGNLNSIATAPLKNREFNRLLALAVDSERRADLVREINNFATGTEANKTGIWLVQLAETFIREGYLDSAALALEEMVRRYEDHDLTPAALLWLAQHYSSSETLATINTHPSRGPNPVDDLDEEQRQLVAKSKLPFFNATPVTVEGGGVRLVSWQMEQNVFSDSVDAVTDETVVDRKKSFQAIVENRLRKSAQYLNKLKQHDFDYAQDARVQFMEAMISGKFPLDKSSESRLKIIRRKAKSDSGYVFAARRELRVRDTSTALLAATCQHTSDRPKLDGKLDETLWQPTASKELTLTKTINKKWYPSENEDKCWLMYDDEFLFIAIDCNKLAELNYERSLDQRDRDMEISDHDRIEFKLDIDRDLQSSFCFAVDYRGGVHDSCAGSHGFNPKWYVAVEQNEFSWFVEAAIPLDELAIQDVDSIDVVAFSLKRLDPWGRDVWSKSNQKNHGFTHEGIAADLEINPYEFELLKFARPVANSAVAELK